MIFPLFKVHYDKLAEDLEASSVPCIVTSSTIDGVSVGEVFDRNFRNRLPSDQVDLFGENGEFHTEAQVWDVDRFKALYE